MKLTGEQISALAQELLEAERSRRPVPPLTDRFPDMSMEEAYAVQRALVQEKLAMGARLVGWKVGLTSKAMQRMFGVETPDFGHLLNLMRIDEGTDVSCRELIQPRLEPEIAFLLKADLRGPGVTAEDVLRGTECLIPALEVIDSRVQDWKIKLADTISDNASSARFVLGKARVPPQGLELRLVGMNFSVDGELVSTATAAAVLGNPAAAVAWLGNTLAPLGEGLKAGQVVMPGSLVGAVEARPGATVTAEFDRIGSVSAKLV